VQQRRGQRAQRHQSEQDERGGRHQETVQRVGRIDRGERNRRSGGRQNGRDIGDRRCFDGGDAFLAARPFAGQQQGQREHAAQHRAYAGAEQAGLDRVAHHEEPAERQRQPADPHHPAGADRFLEAAVSRRQRWWWRDRATRGLFRCLGRRNGLDGLCVGNDGRWCRYGPARGGGQGPLERFKWRERWRHRRGGGRRCCLDRFQALAQLRHLIHGLSCEDQSDDRDQDREENEGVVEHLASRRARRSGNRPRPQPGCNPLCSFVR
jgi:hypothetical protein